MVEDTSREPDPIAEKPSEFQTEQTSNNQRRERHWAFPIIAIVAGGAVAIVGLIRPLMNPPHDIWMVAVGIVFVLSGVAAGLHETIIGWGPQAHSPWSKTIVTATLLLAVIVVIVAKKWTNQFWSEQESHSNQAPSASTQPVVSAPLKRLEQQPTFHEKIEDASIIFGTHGWTTTNALIPLMLDGVPVVRVQVEEGHLFADVIVGRPPKPTIEIHHNEFVVRNPSLDRNSNDNAFEVVVRDTQQPIFQMVKLNASTIQINGIFPRANGDFMVADDTGVHSDEPAKNLTIHLNPIFKYPSWKYPGKYADNSKLGHYPSGVTTPTVCGHRRCNSI